MRLGGSTGGESFSMGGGMMGQGSGIRSGAMRQGPGGGGGQGQLNLDSLFRIADQWTQAASRSGGTGSGLGTALNVLSRAERMRQAGLSLPFASTAGKFNFSYQDSIGHGSNAMGGEIGQGSAQASFNSRSFKNDLMHFSATASYGGMGMGGDGGSGGATSFNQAGGASGHGSGGDGENNPFSGGGNGGGHGSGSMPPPSGGMGGMNMGNGGNHRSGTTAGPTVSLKLSF